MNDLNGLDERLIALFDNAALFWVALVVAVGVGAAHAVAPGHGKSVTAAYLVGTHGRYRDALRLGVIVAVMHTFSVLVLALVWTGLSGVADLGTRTITAVLQVVAGIVVIGVGAHLIRRHLTKRGHHHHHHGDDGHHHHHDVPVDPWSRRGLIALGLSGGLLPSPSAFLILVSGLLTGRSLGAVVIVLGFGVGMALTLTGVGVLTIRGQALLAGRAGRGALVAGLAAWMPAIAGAAVCLGGCLYVAAAVSALAA
ncbi:sulfite exporter TauE/SafE family protein [Micromonospora sp. NPDC049903]|uniref:urease accessory protein UreH domain-containing protein n=1 Tax=Micromonospora sp. NPDC049903 TaxID=3364276 RepID=UPI0037B1E3C5